MSERLQSWNKDEAAIAESRASFILTILGPSKDANLYSCERHASVKGTLEKTFSSEGSGHACTFLYTASFEWS